MGNLMRRAVYGLMALGWAMAPAGNTAQAETHASPQESPKVLVAFGDSLSAGYQVERDASFPAQLEAALQAKGRKVTVVNAGISGDTTAGGVGRVATIAAMKPAGVILELGANDALRGMDARRAKENLAQILTVLQAEKIPVLLAGMKAPMNLGPDYVRIFNGMYPELAKEYDVRLYPFFLEGVAAKPELNLADGLHPNREGIAEIVRRILPEVETLLGEAP